MFIGLISLGAGVFGARLSHVLENLPRYTDPERGFFGNLAAAANISNGGLTFYGGFLVAAAVLIAWAVRRRMPLRLAMDVVAPTLMIGLAFGRVGCLLNGCCWGQTCDPSRVPWAVTFPYGSPPFEEHFHAGILEDVPPSLVGVVETDAGPRAALVDARAVRDDPRLSALAASVRSQPVHPTQIYSSLNAFFVAAVCLAFLRLRPSEGRVFALMLLLYGPSRFALETLRVNPPVALGLSYSMWVSVFTTAAGAALWFAFSRRSRHGSTPVPVGGDGRFPDSEGSPASAGGSDAR